jgi:hypothetical protein
MAGFTFENFPFHKTATTGPPVTSQDVVVAASVPRAAPAWA